MAEDINNTEAPQEIGGMEEGALQQEATLPSEEQHVVTLDDFIKENTSDNGKLFGQFDDVQSALDYYRKQEVTHTNKMRELKNEEKAKQEEIQSVQADLETQQKVQQTIQDLVPQYMQNNMELNDEMISTLKEVGLSEAEIKLGAYELRDKINSAHQVVGGKENYDAMMMWAGENLDEATKADFDKSVQTIGSDSKVGVLAIEALYNRFQNNSKDFQQNGEQQTRLMGQSKPQEVVRGYTNQADMFADRRASEKNPALKAKYLQKLALTDEKVVYGRR